MVALWAWRFFARDRATARAAPGSARALPQRATHSVGWPEQPRPRGACRLLGRDMGVLLAPVCSPPAQRQWKGAPPDHNRQCGYPSTAWPEMGGSTLDL